MAGSKTPAEWGQKVVSKIRSVTEARETQRNIEKQAGSTFHGYEFLTQTIKNENNINMNFNVNINININQYQYQYRQHCLVALAVSETKRKDHHSFGYKIGLTSKKRNQYTNNWDDHPNVIHLQASNCTSIFRKFNFLI